MLTDTKAVLVAAKFQIRLEQRQIRGVMGTNPIVEVFLALGIIILAARVAGGIARYFDQPRVLGELLVGVILGPTVLNILHAPSLGFDAAHLEETIHQFSELGVLFLMFKIGLDVHLKELLGVGKVAGISGVLGAVVPVVLTIPVVMLFNHTWEPALFAGVTLAATSVSISAQVLLELGRLKTLEGNALLATALIDDVVAILLVSLTIAISAPGQMVDAGALVLIVVRMAAYIIVAFLVAWFIVPRLMTWLHRRPEAAQSYGMPAFAIILALLFGWSAEHFGGVAPITGAFIAGVGLSRLPEKLKHPIEDAVSNIAYAFLVPIFFVAVGLQVDLSKFQASALPLALLLLAVAIASKIIGCGLGAYWGGFNRMQSLRLGVSMVSRGEVGLIIASLGLSRGLFHPEDPLFLSLFLVILLTTVITPILVRIVFRMPDSSLVEGA
jgi:Kef-type K+ transport system membrane component KefB